MFIVDSNSKAKKVIDAVQKVADDLRGEGKSSLADRTLSAFNDVPVGSLARLHDLFVKFETKDAALESLGADA